MNRLRGVTEHGNLFARIKPETKRLLVVDIFTAARMTLFKICVDFRIVIRLLSMGL